MPCSVWAVHHNAAQHIQEGLALQDSASLCSPSLSAWSPHPTQHSPALVMGQGTGKTGQDLTADKSFLGPGCQESPWQSQDYSVEYRNTQDKSILLTLPSVGTATPSNTREGPAHLTRRVKKSLLSPSCLWDGAVTPFPRAWSHRSDRASALMTEMDQGHPPKPAAAQQGQDQPLTASRLSPPLQSPSQTPLSLYSAGSLVSLAAAFPRYFGLSSP